MDPYLQRLHDAIRSATRGMSAADLARHPRGKWSTADILEHLTLTYTGTVKGFQRCLQAGKPLANAPRMKQRLAVTVVVVAGYMPGGRQAPTGTHPSGNIPAESILAEIGRQIAAMDEAIMNCERQFGSEVWLVDHPILGPLTAPQWRKFHWVHGRHHLKQILRLRQSSLNADLE